MDLSIGSYKCRLEILLLIIIVVWILFGHLFCSCSRVGMIEGFQIGKQIFNNISKKEKFGGKKEKFGIKNRDNRRREGFKNPYETLKSLTRGNDKVSMESIHEFINTLEVSEEVKLELKSISPHNYIGI